MLKKHKLLHLFSPIFLPQEKQTQMWRQGKEVYKKSVFSVFKKIPFIFLQSLLVFVIMAYTKSERQQVLRKTPLLVTILWPFPRSYIIWKTQTPDSITLKNCEQVFPSLPFSMGNHSQLSHFILCKDIIGPPFLRDSPTLHQIKTQGFLEDTIQFKEHFFCEDRNRAQTGSTIEKGIHFLWLLAIFKRGKKTKQKKKKPGKCNAMLANNC